MINNESLNLHLVKIELLNSEFSVFNLLILHFSKRVELILLETNKEESNLQFEKWQLLIVVFSKKLQFKRLQLVNFTL